MRRSLANKIADPTSGPGLDAWMMSGRLVTSSHSTRTLNPAEGEKHRV
jgi:hypothetical protein